MLLPDTQDPLIIRVNVSHTDNLTCAAGTECDMENCVCRPIVPRENPVTATHFIFGPKHPGINQHHCDMGCTLGSGGLFSDASLNSSDSSIYWRLFAQRSVNVFRVKIYSRHPQALENITFLMDSPFNTTWCLKCWFAHVTRNTEILKRGTFCWSMDSFFVKTCVLRYNCRQIPFLVAWP